MIHYPATYTDDMGTNETCFVSNGSSLSITIRGYAFRGRSFESLLPEDKISIPEGSFSFNEYGALTSCSFKIALQVYVEQDLTTKTATLDIEVIAEASTLLAGNIFRMTLDEVAYELPAHSGAELWFEGKLIQQQRSLPQGTKINTCLFCGYSGYRVAGSDFYGSLVCYKDIKDEIVSVTRKTDYIDVTMGNGTATQETFWCPEFCHIQDGQWVYKDQA